MIILAARKAYGSPSAPTPPMQFQDRAGGLSPIPGTPDPPRRPSQIVWDFWDSWLSLVGLLIRCRKQSRFQYRKLTFLNCQLLFKSIDLGMEQPDLSGLRIVVLDLDFVAVIEARDKTLL